MPGMGSGIQTNNPIIVGAFRNLLQHQAIFVLVLLAIVAVGWHILRGIQLRSLADGDGKSEFPRCPEASARRLTRISFGFLWIFDGILQAQASMPLGMTTQVIEPSAASSPSWVHHLVNAGGTIWSNHPVTAPASVVWIQVGLGIWLLVAPRGNWSRLAGLSSAAWGLVVWVFGESFGGIFAPGLSWAFGAPGAALLYSFAGLLVALPDRAWHAPAARAGDPLRTRNFPPRHGTVASVARPRVLAGQLNRHATPGTLTSMLRQMAQTPQPRILSSWVAAFGSFDAAHGWAVNLFLVIALAGLGLAFLSGRPKVLSVAVPAALVLCVTDWVLVQDLGFLGGVGTDPNSMIPMMVVLTTGYIALCTRFPPRGAGTGDLGN